jgi:uncharacterized cupredoxin-like copper-binding protein
VHNGVVDSSFIATEEEEVERKRALSSLTGIAAVGLLVVACGSPAASPSPGGVSVDVALQEWAVLPEPNNAAAGAVTFTVTNNGPDDEHEFVVIKTDLAPGQLPVDANGVVDEAGGGMEVIDEIEDIPVGETQELMVNLSAGKYALICNIYTESEDEAHYSMGMFTAFTVQ